MRWRRYAPPVAARYGDIKPLPDELLLWFHHLPWDYQLSSGHTLWVRVGNPLHARRSRCEPHAERLEGAGRQD